MSSSGFYISPDDKHRTDYMSIHIYIYDSSEDKWFNYDSGEEIFVESLPAPPNRMSLMTA